VIYLGLKIRRRASFAGTKFGGGGKALLRLSASDGQARAGKNSFPPTPFLPVRSFNEGGPFCPPERKSFSKFSVRIFAKKSSDFVQRSEPIRARLSRPRCISVSCARDIFKSVLTKKIEPRIELD